MVERVLSPSAVVMIDEVLSDLDLRAAADFAEGTSFYEAGMTSRIWAKNRLNPRIGPWFISVRRSLAADGRNVSDSVEPFETGRRGEHAHFRHYPTGMPFDRILETVAHAVDRHGLIRDESPEDPYSGIIGSLFSYGPGTRLVWHTDGEYLGAFAAFLGRDWSENDGGYFAYQPEPTEAGLGIGEIIEPRSNRLVVFAGGIRHSVLTIARDARHPRLSIGGFLIKRSHLARFITASHLSKARKPQPAYQESV